MASPVLDRSAASLGAGRVDAADSAIAQVLHAEQQARDAVAQCARQADQELQLARSRARAIAARGAARSARIHHLIEQRLASRLAVIAAARARLGAVGSSDDADPARIDRAAARLAAELSGAGAE